MEKNRSETSSERREEIIGIINQLLKEVDDRKLSNIYKLILNITK